MTFRNGDATSSPSARPLADAGPSFDRRPRSDAAHLAPPLRARVMAAYLRVIEQAWPAAGRWPA